MLWMFCFLFCFVFTDDYVISIGIQKAFEDLLIEYEVDLAFWAHYHSYERTCPMQKGQCTPGAPVHIVVGTAGKDLDTEDYYPVPWSLFHENDYGYGKLTLNTRTELQWQWVENKSGQVKDSVTLKKDVPSLSKEVWAWTEIPVIRSVLLEIQGVNRQVVKNVVDNKN